MNVFARVTRPPLGLSSARRQSARMLYAPCLSTTPRRWDSASPILPGEQPPLVIPTASSTTHSSPPNSSSSAPIPSPEQGSVAGPIPPPPLAEIKKPPKIRASKAAITLTPTAVLRLRNLMNGPTPQLIRIGVKNKGCAGMSYHLDYVEKPGKFDDIVEQDGVKVLIDSKALFSIIGSEMDWTEDRLSSKFAFRNPNIVDACGCGESFNVGQ